MLNLSVFVNRRVQHIDFRPARSDEVLVRFDRISQPFIAGIEHEIHATKATLNFFDDGESTILSAALIYHRTEQQREIVEEFFDVPTTRYINFRLAKNLASINSACSRRG